MEIANAPSRVLSVLLSALFFLSSNVFAETLKLKKLTQNVYAIVGELVNRTDKNLGNNANFGFIVTQTGVVLIDSGGTRKGAEKIHALIKSVTDKPITTVINTGGQDHRWLGNQYFKQQGAQIFASAAAVKDQKARFADQFNRLGSLLSDQSLSGTEPLYADITFENRLDLKRGGYILQLHHYGQAHTPGDSYVWLPKQNILFTGDIVYVDRMLGVGSQSNSKSWLEVYQKMAQHPADILVPGHGSVTTFKTANKDTRDYLTELRAGVSNFLDEGNDLSEIGSIDQSKYQYLFNYDTLAGRNAQQVYTELEWE